MSITTKALDSLTGLSYAALHRKGRTGLGRVQHPSSNSGSICRQQDGSGLFDGIAPAQQATGLHYDGTTLLSWSLGSKTPRGVVAIEVWLVTLRVLVVSLAKYCDVLDGARCSTAPAWPHHRRLHGGGPRGIGRRQEAGEESCASNGYPQIRRRRNAQTQVLDGS